MIDFRIAEVSARSPDMSTREFDEFVDDIRTNGQLVPIWKLGDEVIDGRKRLAACERLGITPMFVNMDPSQDRERVARALNILRTHYSQTQRAIFAAGRATAKEGRPEKLPKLGEFQPVTVRQAADEAGVAASSVSRARQIARTAAPEVVDAMKRGDLTLHAAGQITEKIPKAEQPAAVEKVVSESRGKAHQSPARVLDGVDVRRHRAVPKKPLEQFSRSILMVSEGARVLLANAPHVANATERADWIETLTEARTALTRTLKALEA